MITHSGCTSSSDAISSGEAAVILEEAKTKGHAIVAACDLVLADEPSASLDEINRDLVGHAFLVASQAKAVLAATHDPELVAGCDRVLRFLNGQIDEIDQVDEAGDRAPVA